MTVVDVNTGKFTGSGGNLEETVTKNNLEAAEEIVRQLRLRDIGGIIVVDFIDMVLESNRDLVLRRLVECLGRDRTRHQVAEVTSLGLVQMTRKRIGTGLLEAFSHECEHCHGRGVVIEDAPVEPRRSDDDGGRRTGRRGRGRGDRAAERPVERPVQRTVRDAADAQGRRRDGQAPRRAPRARRARRARTSGPPRPRTRSTTTVEAEVDESAVEVDAERRRGRPPSRRPRVEEAPVEDAPVDEAPAAEPRAGAREPEPPSRPSRPRSSRGPDAGPPAARPGRRPSAPRPRRRPARCWWTTPARHGRPTTTTTTSPAPRCTSRSSDGAPASAERRRDRFALPQAGPYY